MIICKTENRLFFSLYIPLLFYTNRYLNIYKKIKKIDDIFKTDVKYLANIRDKLYSNLELFDYFQEDNPNCYNEIGKEILNNWKSKYIKDNFIIFRHLKKYSIFIQVKNFKLYGVYSLTDELNDKFPSKCLPIIVETVILPFKDKIIYDGLISLSRVTIGRNLFQDINEEYKKKKENEGIFEKI